MALNHTIMTYIGVLITVVIFGVMLFVPEKRKLVFGPKGQLKNLLLTAILTVLSASYYIIPMLEQLLNDRFRFHDPWAQIGDYPQSLRSFFKPVGVFLYTADFGVGIPVLFLLTGRIFLGKLKNKWADFYLASGVLLLLVMSRITPWKYLQNTQLNMIQFTYRFYPYALFFLICGMSVAYAEKKKDGWVNRCFLLFIIVISIVCGIWENIYCYNFGTRVGVNMDYLRENSYLVGAGEWLPEGVSAAVADGQGTGMVTAEKAEYEWMVRGYNSYCFSVDEGSGTTYIAPLVYYKGYRAEFISPGGETQELPVSKSEDGLVRIDSPQDLSGMIEVRYTGTVVQTISNVISGIVILGICVAFICKKRKKFKQI